MAKQAGARFPDGLGRGAGARGTRVPQAERLAHAPDGRAPWAVRLNADAAARPGQFFLSDGEFSGGESSERAELLRKHLPGEAAEILREADEICGHRFRLLGYENLDFTLDSSARMNATDGRRSAAEAARVAGSNGMAEAMPLQSVPGTNLNRSFLNSGNEIDWHLDPVHGKRAPLDPWFKIPFLDFAVVGDHKVMWELNRHQHLVTLAKARLLSGDEKYTRELMAQWRSWIKANPYPLGINWASALEVAFRSLSWIWVDQLLAGTAGHAEFRAEMAPALAFHGCYIERYLSTYFSPNTHLLGEAVALFFLGTLYPQMPRAALWKKSGWRIVLHEAGRQVRPDGVYFEQSLYYHVYALDFFLYARLLAARNGMEIPPAYDAVLGRMLDVVAALAQAGPAEGFGDDDGGRLFNPRRNRTEHMTDPLALGAVILLQRVFRGTADGGIDLVVWRSSSRETRTRALEYTNESGCAFVCFSRRRRLPAGGFRALRTGDGRRCRSAGRGPLGARTRRRPQPATHHGWAALAGGLRKRRLHCERSGGPECVSRNRRPQHAARG